MYIWYKDRLQLIAARFVVGERMDPGIEGVQFFFGTYVENV